MARFAVTLRTALPLPILLIAVCIVSCAQRASDPPAQRVGPRAAALALVTSLVALQAVMLWHQYSRRASLQQELSTAVRRLAFTWGAAEVGMVELGEGVGWANMQFLRIGQLSAQSQMTVELLFSVIHPDDHSTLRAAIESAERLHESYECEVRLAKHDGQERWARLTLLAESAVSKVRLRCLAVDISARKQTEILVTEQRRQLAHLARVSLLGELSSALAHELKQPLTSILSNAEAAQYLLEGSELDLQEFRKILHDIVRDDKRAGDVITRMRGLLIRGETDLQRVEIDQLVAGVLSLQHSNLVARNIRLITAIRQPLPAVLADPIELEQVLMNLVMNACEAMVSIPAHERAIEVAAEVLEDSREIHMSVMDEGRGIAPDQLKRVFDPFFSTKQGGLGVGLAICRSIIAAHGGRIWAGAASGRFKGAAFHFTIPIPREEYHGHVASESLSG